MHALVPGLLPDPGERLTLAQLAEGLSHYDHASLAVLRPFNVGEALSVKQAARIAGCTPRTVCQWADRFRTGRLVGAMRISHPMLLALLDDDATAIAALLAGQRQHPAVLPYLERAGLRIS